MPTLKIQPIKDAYVCNCKPDETNPNGNSKVLYQGQFKDCFDRTLIQWDLKQLKNASKILRAQIHIYHKKLYLHGAEKHGKLAYFPVIEDWDQNNITFNTLPKIDESQKIVFEFPEKEGWHIVDIIEIAQKWSDGSLENHGLYCHSEGTKSTCVSKFVSSEGDPKNLRPFLLIEYK